MLTYKCPKTGDFVETTIETTEDVLRRLGQFKLSVWCTHCQEPHQIMGADAFVMAKLEGGRRRAHM